MTEDKDLDGLGGWLTLVGLGLMASPIYVVVAALVPLWEIFSTDIWALLTTPGSEAYHPLFKPILNGELAVNGGLVLGYMAALYLFFKKKVVFPKVYIWLLLIPVVVIPLDAYVVTLVVPEEPMFDADTIKQLSRALVAALIWVPYMLRSKRVAATFVR